MALDSLPQGHALPLPHIESAAGDTCIDSTTMRLECLAVLNKSPDAIANILFGRLLHVIPPPEDGTSEDVGAEIELFLPSYILLFKSKLLKTPSVETHPPSHFARFDVETYVREKLEVAAPSLGDGVGHKRQAMKAVEDSMANQLVQLAVVPRNSIVG